MELESNIVHTLSPNIDSIRVVAVTNHHKFSTLEIGGAPCGKVIHPTFPYIKAFPSPSSVSFVINIDNNINTNRLLSKPLPPPSSVMQSCHTDASCHLGVMRTLKMLERFYWWVDMEACTKWWVRRCLKCQVRKTSRQTVRWPAFPIPLHNSPGVAVSVDHFGPLPITARGN